MMLTLAALADALVGPDPAPARAAVEQCNRAAMTAITAAEPRRRARFSSAVYDEERAIAAERAALDAGKTTASPAAVTALEMRQRRLDDARRVENAWRLSLDDLRADFLLNCASKGARE